MVKMNHHDKYLSEVILFESYRPKKHYITHSKLTALPGPQLAKVK